MDTIDAIKQASAKMDAARVPDRDRCWMITPAIADLAGIIRDQVDATGAVILPNGNLVIVPAWAQEDNA